LSAEQPYLDFTCFHALPVITPKRYLTPVNQDFVHPAVKKPLMTGLKTVLTLSLILSGNILLLLCLMNYGHSSGITGIL
jgi:hypothetical protein